MVPEFPTFIAFKISQNYFVVFDRNTSLIGKITNKKIGGDIVRIYISIKAFADTLNLYTEYFQQYYNSLLLPIETETQKMQQKNAQAANEEKLEELSRNLQKEYENLKPEVEKLISDIKDFLEE